MMKKRIKNIENVDGVKYYKRWVVLGVEVEIINMIRRYANKNGINIRRAFTQMITKASKNDEN
jgi:hypothetical protein